ncbi:MAG TPA: hypothetical protein VK999_02570 [Methylotenera sp.]|nr:hypothetical protein [Methylotenera sp.]
MKTYAARQLLTLLALALMLHVPSLSAAPSAESLSAIDWPLQRGESVQDLARLIYPKSQRMQQYFIAETIRLNREQQPDLHPNTAFAQQQQIIIPSIKQLSGKSRAGARR